MYARLLATVCLLSCSVLIGRGEALSTRGLRVGVYLQTDANASGLSLEAMRLELRDLMVPTGVSLTFTSARNTSADRLVVVTLRGNCQAGAKASGKFKDKTPLASTAVTDGKVLPFSWVDCNALNKFLKTERAEIFGRAMGRLLAHELYHVLTQTEAHTSAGISKASFSKTDLLAPFFTFEPEAIANLHFEQPTQTLASLERAEESLGYEYIPAPDPVEALAGR